MVGKGLYTVACLQGTPTKPGPTQFLFLYNVKINITNF